MAATTHTKSDRDEYLELVRRLPLKPIRDDDQLRDAHRVIDELTKIPEEQLSQDQLDYLQVLGDLTSAFEDQMVRAELDGVTGLDVLKHLLEANDMNASDLGRLVGQRELGSKILRGDRGISRTHAAKLSAHFGLPAEMFLRASREVPGEVARKRGAKRR